MIKPFNFNYAEADVLKALAAFRDGSGMKSEIVGLIKRGWVKEIGYHHRALTPVGRIAQHGIFTGSAVLVTDSYRVPYMRGRHGSVKSVHSIEIDSDGFDEFGYQTRWAKHSAIVTATFPNYPGEWCFYEMNDLVPVARC